MNSESIKQHMAMGLDAADIPYLAARPIGTPLPQPETVLSINGHPINIERPIRDRSLNTTSGKAHHN